MYDPEPQERPPQRSEMIKALVTLHAEAIRFNAKLERRRRRRIVERVMGEAEISLADGRKSLHVEVKFSE